jgi:hypothetical protein
LTKLPLEGTASLYARAADAGWSPDGKTIVFTLFTDPQGGTATINIYTANADWTGVQQMTHDTSLGFADDSPDWGGIRSQRDEQAQPSGEDTRETAERSADRCSDEARADPAAGEHTGGRPTWCPTGAGAGSWAREPRSGTIPLFRREVAVLRLTGACGGRPGSALAGSPVSWLLSRCAVR